MLYTQMLAFNPFFSSVGFSARGAGMGASGAGSALSNAAMASGAESEGLGKVLNSNIKSTFSTFA